MDNFIRLHPELDNYEDSRLNIDKYVLSTGKPKLPNSEYIWNSITAEHKIIDLVPYDVFAKLYQLSKSNLPKNSKVNQMVELLKFYNIFLIGVGTNRVAFQPINHPKYILKIALDDIGRRDSPKELINQEFLRPYVSKIFEVTSCGTIALSEAVYPIKNKADFIKYLDMIVTTILIPVIGGKFAMDDIGFENFMNYGIREGFGPVLLDFPYLFKYDKEKMKCKNMIGGKPCGGHIDYEVGFMDFVCDECGQRFSAKEIGIPLYDTLNVIDVVRDNENKDIEDYTVKYNSFSSVQPREEQIRLRLLKNGIMINRPKRSDSYDRIRVSNYQIK